MPSLVDTLRQLSTAPPRTGGAFDEWIMQEDTPSFLAANAQETEVVIYASLQHMFLQTVVVPLNALDPLKMDELQEWELMHDRWGMNYSYNEPLVWLEAPFKDEKNEALRNGEKLVFTRSFEGLDSNKNYFEILQKFAHVFDLHYVSHKKAWCRLNENGDVESILRIISLTDKAGLGTGAAIVVAQRVLDEYLLMSNAVAIRAFDFTRFDGRFPGWGNNRQETKRRDSEFAYRLTIELGVGSYMRGVQIVRPVETMAQLHYRLTHRYDAREYVSFIAHDWKNGVVREISCAPDSTTNYFTQSDLPFEVTPAFFRPEVLTKYKADPEKYKVEERSVSCRGSWNLRTYDINDQGQVHTYLVYLRDLPYSEQLYWKAFNEVPKGTISKRAIKTDFDGEFDLTYNPLQSILSFTHKLKKSGVPWWKLRADDLLSRVHYPATEATEEWANGIMVLDQLIVEGLEVGWLKTKAQELGQKLEVQDASLMLTERCLRGLGLEEQMAKATVAPLRTLHHLRTKMKGHAAGSSAQELRQTILEQHGTYRAHFEHLCSECDTALRTITKAFGQEANDA